MLAWAVYFVLVAYFSRRIGDRVTLALSALPFAAVASLLAWRILEGHEGAWPILNTKTLLDLVVLGLSYAALHLAAGVTPFPFYARLAARTLIEGVVAILLWRELIGLPHGDHYVLLAWPPTRPCFTQFRYSRRRVSPRGPLMDFRYLRAPGCWPGS